MNRSQYSDDVNDDLQFGRWRGQVASAIRGKRGQAFLRELADAMDGMAEKVLIAEELIDENGDCCTIGVVCKARGLDVTTVDIEDPEAVGALVGIAHQLAAEIEYLNDDWKRESPEARWVRMRKWVDSHCIKSGESVDQTKESQQ